MIEYLEGGKARVRCDGVGCQNHLDFIVDDRVISIADAFLRRYGWETRKKGKKIYCRLCLAKMPQPVVTAPRRHLPQPTQAHTNVGRRPIGHKTRGSHKPRKIF